MKILLSFLLILSTNLLTNAQNPDPDFHIYILMGQSNMAGRGVITEEFEKVEHERVLTLNKDNNWVLAKHPLHFDKPKVVGVGPGLAFGISMAKANKNVKIGLVPCAVGGSSIQHWKPGAYDDRTNTHPWEDAKIRMLEAMKYGVIKGIVWQQGESDSAPDKAEHYLQDLEDLILRTRVLVGNANLPIAIGQLPRYKEQYQNINKVLKEVPQEIPHTAIASSKGLTDKGDGTHYSAGSSQKFGTRLAKKMRKLQK